MKTDETPEQLGITCEWAQRVNRQWIVRHGLNQCAENWLEYLTPDPQRYLCACRRARYMCNLRPREDDPKPWFYNGLFSVATVEEAKKYLAGFWLSSSAVPALRNDAAIKCWLSQRSVATRELVTKLRAGMDECLAASLEESPHDMEQKSIKKRSE